MFFCILKLLIIVFYFFFLIFEYFFSIIINYNKIMSIDFFPPFNVGFQFWWTIHQVLFHFVSKIRWPHIFLFSIEMELLLGFHCLSQKLFEFLSDKIVDFYLTNYKSYKIKIKFQSYQAHSIPCPSVSALSLYYRQGHKGNNPFP